MYLRTFTAYHRDVDNGKGWPILLDIDSVVYAYPAFSKENCTAVRLAGVMEFTIMASFYDFQDLVLKRQAERLTKGKEGCL